MMERLFKHHPFALAFALFSIIALILALFVQNELDARDAQDARFKAVVEVVAREQVSRRVDDCESANTGRAALQAVLEQVADPPPSGSAAVDFSAVKGWDDLTPPVQFFLANLTLTLQDTAPNYIVQVAENYKESNPQRDCDALRRSLGRELDIAYPN